MADVTCLTGVTRTAPARLPALVASVLRCLRALSVLGVLVTVRACAPASSTAGGPGRPATNSVPGATAGPTDDCPALEAVPGEGAAVDYADVLRFGGRQYVAHTPTVPATAQAQEVGELPFRVRCSFGELNPRTGQKPPALRDGDSGWLPAGTEVHALRGWSPTCRLVAQHDRTWLVYAAIDPAAGSARPAACPPTPTS